MNGEHVLVRRSRSDEKRSAILRVARAAFFREGYSGLTMSEIAATVGGSKTTIWNYFSSKQELFAEVVEDLLDEHSAILTLPLPPDAPVGDVLENAAVAILAKVTSSRSSISPFP